MTHPLGSMIAVGAVGKGDHLGDQTIDKSRRDEQVGHLPAAIVDRIDVGLRLVLGL